MKKSDNQSPARDADPAGKQPWTAPTLRRMKAGSAEVGTRNNNDGAFTTS